MADSTESNTVQAGQTACFMAGVYPINVSDVNSTGGFQNDGTTQGGYSQICCTNSRSSGSPITFTNYMGSSSSFDTAVIQGATKVTSSFIVFQGAPVETVRSPGLVFEGPTETQEPVVGILDGAHDVTFDHVEIRNDDFRFGFYEEAGYNIKLTGSYIHDNGRWGEYNVSVGGSYPKNTDQGIYIKSTTTTGSNLIANNVIEHNVSFGIQLYGGSISNLTIEENTVVDNGNSGMALVALVFSSRSGNVVANNILAYNGEAAANPQMNNRATGTTITTNLFWDPNSSDSTCWNGSSVDSTYCGTNPIVKDPLFVVTPGTNTINGASETNTHGYFLSNSSPAIAVGDSTYTQTVDIDGLTRDTPPDLGAFENIIK